MKKTRFLALTLIVAMMLMGAGYAYWSESMTISNTINTGELNFEFSSPTAKQEKLKSYATAKVDPNNNKRLNVTWNNTSPGAYFEFITKVKNTGSIDAGITNFQITGIDKEFAKHVYLAYVLVYRDGHEPNRINLYMPYNEFDDVMKFVLSKHSEFSHIDLQADETIKLEFGLYLDHDATEEQIRENGRFTFDITADVLQINEINPGLNRFMFKRSIND